MRKCWTDNVIVMDGNNVCHECSLAGLVVVLFCICRIRYLSVSKAGICIRDDRTMCADVGVQPFGFFAKSITMMHRVSGQCSCAGRRLVSNS